MVRIFQVCSLAFVLLLVSPLAAQQAVKPVPKPGPPAEVRSLVSNAVAPIRAKLQKDAVVFVAVSKTDGQWQQPVTLVGNDLSGEDRQLQSRIRPDRLLSVEYAAKRGGGKLYVVGRVNVDEVDPDGSTMPRSRSSYQLALNPGEPSVISGVNTQGEDSQAVYFLAVWLVRR